MAELCDAGERLITYTAALWPEIDPGVPFVSGWAMEAICEHLEAVTAGQIKKLLINVPPGFSKSSFTNVYWPSWEWGPMNRAAERYVCTSYDQALVIRDNIKCRNLILSDAYQMAWGDRFAMADDQNTKVKFSNDKTGWKAAKAIGGLTGERGSRFLWDDPQSALGAESEAEVETSERIFAHAMPTRTQTKDDAFVGITQRLRENDMSGFVLANEFGYEHLVIPMHHVDNHPFARRTKIGWRDPRSVEGDPSRGYFAVSRDAEGREVREWRSSWHDGLVASGYLAFPDRFPPEHVSELEKALASKDGTRAVAGQLEQQPFPEGGALFELAWFKVWVGKAPASCPRMRGWDLASSLKGDWTVGVLIARLPKNAGFVVEDVVRFRGKPGTVKARIVATAQADGKKTWLSVPRDPGNGEWAVADLVASLPGYKVHNSREERDKKERAKPVAAQAEMGFFYVSDLVDRREAEGLPGKKLGDVYRSEHVAFPNGTYDDCVDATSRALGALTEVPEPAEVGASPISATSTSTAPCIYEGDESLGYE